MKLAGSSKIRRAAMLSCVLALAIKPTQANAVVLTSAVYESPFDDLRAVLCWEASRFDQDGDGYADYFADKSERVTRYVADPGAGYAAQCPNGWVLARGDCDDNDASVRPRRAERPENGVDDNCDGRTDEARLIYGPYGNQNGEGGFTIRMALNDSALLNAWDAIANTTWPDTPLYERLVYRVEYQPLDDTSATRGTWFRPVNNITSSGVTNVRLEGLQPGTVYRARVRFYGEIAGGWGWPQFAAIGDWSGWYYTATSSGNALGKARTRIVLRALFEVYLNSLGVVGHMGSRVDGTRYGADENEWWCSEFYSWVSKFSLEGMGHRSNTRGLISYFNAHGAFVAGDSVDITDGSLARGDYLAMGTGDVATHSSMFLAYDSAKMKLWTIDGNVNGFFEIGDTSGMTRTPWSLAYSSRRAFNEAFVSIWEPTVGIVGAGTLQSSMLP